MHRVGVYPASAMAKDTEKLIRQLSLISFLMAQGRPISALEIKREVEGYSDMNDDAFARRFYADRAELESLGITLQVEKPGESLQGYESELYSLPPENYYLPEIRVRRRRAGGAADRPPAARRRVRLRRAAAAGAAAGLLGAPEPADRAGAVLGRDADDRQGRRRRALAAPLQDRDRDLPPQDDRVHLLHDRARLEEKRKVDPYHLVYRGGQFYLIGHSHERDAVRVFRLSRIRGKVSYASKAEHDFAPPEDFDRRDYARRAEWQLGEIQGTAKIFLRDRIAWLVERDFGAYGEFRNPGRGDGAPGKGRIFETEYASSRQMVAWVLRWRQNATVLDPPELRRGGGASASSCSRERHSADFEPAETGPDRAAGAAVGPLQRPLASPRSGPSASPAW